MHPRLAEILAYVDQQTATLRDVYDAVPPERRATRPAPDRWSPAEVVHHVAIVERRVTRMLATLAEQARTFPREDDASPILPSIRIAGPVDRSRRFTSAEASQPRDTDPATVWTELDSARRGSLDVVAAADGLALGRVSAPHPALGELDAYGWIAFLGAHAARHAEQIREIAAGLPAAGAAWEADA